MSANPVVGPHRIAIDPEGVDGHPMRWPLFSITLVRPHSESAARKPDHVGKVRTARAAAVRERSGAAASTIVMLGGACIRLGRESVGIPLFSGGWALPGDIAPH